jgi:HEAT repeat protein
LALARIGPPAKAALPALRTALRDKNGEMRARAAIALWRIDGNSKEAMPVFVATLKRRKGDRPDDSNAWAARQVVRALGEMGPRAKKAVPALLPLLKDKNEGLRWWTRQALKKIDPPVANKAGAP